MPLPVLYTECLQYVQHTIHVQCRYIHSTYSIAQLNVEKVGRRVEKEAGSSLPTSHPPSPNLYTKPCSVRRPTTYNTTTTHPSLCHAKEKGKERGVRTFKETGAVGEQLRTAQQQKRIRSPVSILLPSVGGSVGTLFPPLGVPFPTPFHPRCCRLFCSFGGGGGKAFRRPSPFPPLPCMAPHTASLPLFSHRAFAQYTPPLFPLLPSFLARRAKKGTLSCSSSGGGELPTNPLLFPKRAPSPPQQAPRNRTADGVRESCSRMYGIAAVRTVYCCCGGGQKGEGGWTKGESTLAALQCAA